MSLSSQVADVLAADLAALVSNEGRVSVDGGAREWRLPDADKAALERWGLVSSPMIDALPQFGAEPSLTPNVAGDRERALLRPDQRLYLLGRFGPAPPDMSLTVHIGAVSEVGTVLGVSERPMTTDDIPEVLRVVYAGHYRPSVQFMNSSVAQFVDLSWRWRAIRDLLMTTDTNAVDVYLDDSGGKAQMLDGFVRIDEALADIELNSLWRSLILDD